MIIIDIDLPERCGECPCFHAAFPMHCQLIKPPDKNKQLAAPYGLPRPDWCPLKEQEAVKPRVDADGSFNCGNCGELVGFDEHPFTYKVPKIAMKFCCECGKPVKWE